MYVAVVPVGGNRVTQMLAETATEIWIIELSDPESRELFTAHLLNGCPTRIRTSGRIGRVSRSNKTDVGTSKSVPGRVSGNTA